MAVSRGGFSLCWIPAPCLGLSSLASCIPDHPLAYELPLYTFEGAGLAASILCPRRPLGAPPTVLLRVKAFFAVPPPSPPARLSVLIQAIPLPGSSALDHVSWDPRCGLLCLLHTHAVLTGQPGLGFGGSTGADSAPSGAQP